MICECGNKIKIIAFVTHSAEINRILKRIGWQAKIPEFDPPNNFDEFEICQLISGTEDGFLQEDDYTQGPDPPFIECNIDSPPFTKNNSNINNRKIPPPLI